MRSTLNCKVEQTVIVEKNGHCVYKLTAQKYFQPPNDADIEMEISKLKN